ncbi:F-actin-capping protein subunit alpha [Galendromus occidentalis]|uniref:F-actin-capping protein subunit alpha n=1 Tax=Galendromus occidentalis TaxID=34638 RepID=A0AAJ6QN66_9ACAR|nr:F-actin-capping protein subunit alpha [Galendromus occidentalis]
MDDTVGASDNEKIKIISGFMGLCPPGEFNEVFNDCRVLVGNDELLKKAASSTIAEYHMDQLTPCTIGGFPDKSLVTHFNALPDSRYYDPRQRVSFRFDHYKREAMDPQPMESSQTDTAALRASLDEFWSTYCLAHYKHGVSAVFDQSDNEKQEFVLCIEDHQFQSHNYWNGRWRGVWTVSLQEGRAAIKGTIKVQVHYYEDGNVQLQATKNEDLTVNVENDNVALAQCVVNAIRDAEGKYQDSINENYKWMNDKTFKALRRNLPLTRSKIDWQKILSYRVASEISNKQQ